VRLDLTREAREPESVNHCREKTTRAGHKKRNPDLFYWIFIQLESALSYPT
jgi:hypothetical protein